ncbi:MAG: elongation factor Ts [Candidatus Paceibacterota bacterium]
MVITTEQIKELRDTTGLSIMQCKKALEETAGDMGKAIILLQKKGAGIAAKKADRNLGAGKVAAYVHSTGNIASLVELLCETDFVAKNEEFGALAYNIAMQIAATNPQYLKMADIPAEARAQAEEVFAKEVEGKPADMKAKILEGKINAYFKDKVLLEQEYIKNPEVTINGLIESFIQKFGERTEIGRFIRIGVGQK